jgi:hypothetical protein
VSSGENVVKLKENLVTELAKVDELIDTETKVKALFCLVRHLANNVFVGFCTVYICFTLAPISCKNS